LCVCVLHGLSEAAVDSNIRQDVAFTSDKLKDIIKDAPARRV